MISTECPTAVLVMSLQSIIGVLITVRLRLEVPGVVLMTLGGYNRDHVRQVHQANTPSQDHHIQANRVA